MFGEFETFEIKHTSYSRNVFAEGALKAAKFICNKKCGFYNMGDLKHLSKNHYIYTCRTSEDTKLIEIKHLL